MLVAAQEGGFMGGGVGEVHGAKLVGLLRARAATSGPAAVLLLVESGGVRLHEANAGLIAVSEVMRAVLDVARRRHSGDRARSAAPTAASAAWASSRAAATRVVMSEEGRLGLSGPEVIEATHGVEEFDARDRALVWRTIGGKHRYLLGEAAVLVDDDLIAFRAAALSLLDRTPDLYARGAGGGARSLRRDAWSASATAATRSTSGQRLGIAEPERLPILDADDVPCAPSATERA